MAFMGRIGGNKNPSVPASLYLPPPVYQFFNDGDQARIKLNPNAVEKPRTYKRQVTGSALFTKAFESFAGGDEELPSLQHPLMQERKIRQEKLAAQLRKKERYEQKLLHDANEYSARKNAEKNPQNVTDNPLNTLFVARLSYETNENRLQEIFEKFGSIKELRLVRDLSGKSRGYAFIEYESGVDMKEAYRHGNKLEIDGKIVLTDVERARTIKAWKPRRLGGGLGGASRRTAIRAKGTAAKGKRSRARSVASQSQTSYEKRRR